MLEKKVYILGGVGCGKSSLLYALTGTEVKTDLSSSPHQPSVRRTTQVDVVSKLEKKRCCCLCPCLKFGSSRITTKEEKLSLIFIENVEKESRLRAINYLDTDAVVLCFDVNSHESLEELKEVWLPEVNYYCPVEVPVLLAGLKDDKKRSSFKKEPLSRRASSLFRRRKMDRTQREADGLVTEENLFTYVQCSSKDGKGLEELKNNLCRAVTMTTTRSKSSSPALINEQTTEVHS